jgi:hypothetical protein
MKQTTRLRQLLAQERTLSARILERAAFPPST